MTITEKRPWIRGARGDRGLKGVGERGEKGKIMQLSFNFKKS